MSNEEDHILKKNRSWTGIIMVVIMLLLVTTMFGDSLLGMEDKTIAYPELLTMIQENRKYLKNAPSILSLTLSAIRATFISVQI